MLTRLAVAVDLFGAATRAQRFSLRTPLSSSHAVLVAVFPLLLKSERLAAHRLTLDSHSFPFPRPSSPSPFSCSAILTQPAVRPDLIHARLHS